MQNLWIFEDLMLRKLSKFWDFKTLFIEYKFAQKIIICEKGLNGIVVGEKIDVDTLKSMINVRNVAFDCWMGLGKWIERIERVENMKIEEIGDSRNFK